jgi:DNA-binding YbaB/EbfC family protein
MMKQAQEMQQKMAEMQAKLEEEESEGSSGGGMVKVVMQGNGKAKSIAIDPSLLAPAEKEMLEDLIIAAFNDAKSKQEKKMSEEMGQLTGGLGLPPGIKLPF